MSIKSSKAQAALEFLTTYAWAFIVIGIVVAAVIYFGVTNPSRILPDRCNFNAGFGCEAYTIGSAGGVRTLLRNNLGEPVTVTGIAISTENGAYTCTASPANPTNWAAGTTQDLAWTGCDAAAAGFSSGDKGKLFLRLSYYETRDGAAFGKIADGEMYTAVT